MSNEQDLEDDDNSPEEPEATPARAPKKKRPPTLGSTATPAASGFHRESDQADDVWDEICAWLPSHNLAPNNVAIQVKRLTPPGPGGMQMPAGDFGGDAVAPTENRGPGSALVDYMIRYVHLPTMQAAATYQVRFRHKSTGVPIAIGNLALPDRQTCLNMLNAQIDASQATGPGVGAIPPRAPPVRSSADPYAQQQYPQAPPPYTLPPGFGPPSGYGAPPQAPNMPPEAWQMMQSMMDRAFAERGFQPPPPPPAPGVAAPMNEDAIVQRVTAGVLMALQKVPGIGAPSAPAAAAVAQPPPPPTQASGLAGMVEKMAGNLMENIIQAAGKNMESSIKQSMGMGAPGVVAEEAADETPEAPTKPEDLLPWQAAPTGANWANGTPVVYAKPKPKEDGSDPTLMDHLAGFAMNNPAALEKVIEVGTGLAGALKDYLARPSLGMTRMVPRIPAGAVDAGVGYAPPAPSLPPDGNKGGGWAP